MRRRLSAEFYGRIAKAARLYKEGSHGLWRDPELQLALNWEKGNKPTGSWATRYHSDFQGALEFLNQSKWRRTIRRALAIAFILFLALSWGQSVVLRKKANQAAEVARQKEKAAQEAAAVARAEALQVRKRNLENQSLIVALADRLIEQATKEEGIFLHEIKAGALSQIGKHEEAILEYERVTEQLDRDNLRGPINLGWEYILSDPPRPEKALKQNELVIEKNAANWVTYQNKAIALAMLGEYTNAGQAMQKSINLFNLFNYSGDE